MSPRETTLSLKIISDVAINYDREVIFTPISFDDSDCEDPRERDYSIEYSIKSTSNTNLTWWDWTLSEWQNALQYKWFADNDDNMHVDTWYQGAAYAFYDDLDFDITGVNNTEFKFYIEFYVDDSIE